MRSKHPKGKFWLNLFCSTGLRAEFNECFETILTSETEILEELREFFIYINYILAPQYNKCYIYCLHTRYFIYEVEEYLIYFS